jgi:O-methyltransferase involved in polyketide biosynthesis
MPSRQRIQLGRVQETLLVPLYARALDSLKKRPILKDPKAVEMVQSIDWDFRRFNQRRRVVGATWRTAIFDEWVKGFLSRHPEGTVVEIGAGLNTRFERLDNGVLHWFDLDLPDTVELRRRFFTDSARRVTLAASILDPGWMAAVRQSPGPYCFVAEAVFIYLTEPEVKAALAQIAANFPGATIAFDTATLRGITHENRDHARRNLDARFAWGCEDPREIERWKIGLRLVESRTWVNVPDSLRSRLSLPTRAVFRVVARLLPKLAEICRFNLFVAQREACPAANEGDACETAE